MAEGKGTDHALERLVFFSDAVFAIAITLLVIEIHPPHLPHGAPDAAHWQALAGLAPNFFGYAVSFAVIGAFWMGHHRSFALAGRYHPRVFGPNLALLAVIAFMPFVTAYMSANLGERVPTVFYCAWMLLAGLFNYRANSIATGPRMVRAEVPADEIIYVRRRSLSVILGAATALLISLVLPRFAQLGLITIPLWRSLLVGTRMKRSETQTV